MNKYLIKAKQLHQASDIESALKQYEKALHHYTLDAQEKFTALYMSAYLHCMLAKPINQVDLLLGVDLRQTYQDHYLIAALHLSQITDNEFTAAEFDLPKISAEAYALVEDAYQYYTQTVKVV